MKKVKITVKKIACHKELMQEYENPLDHACDMREGQIFICENATRPKNFCKSAWHTLYPFVLQLAAGGGNFYNGWMKNPRSAMLSCNDGFRPVSFLIETME